MSHKLVIFLLLSPLVSLYFTAVSAHSQIVVRPYDWVKIGAYAKYYSTDKSVAIALPNGTKRHFNELYSPILFDWTIINKKESRITLNVTFFINGLAWGPNLTLFNVTFHKTLLVEIDIYTRESFIGDESIGKTCFWAEPYKEVGDNITVFSNPDLLEANVWWVKSGNWPTLEKEIKRCGAELFCSDPDAAAWGNYVFSWYTGIALQLSLLGPPWEVPPDKIGNFQGHLKNCTEYNITRYAGARLGEYLGLAPKVGLPVDLYQTNIDLTLETEPEPPNLSDFWKYLPHAFVVTFATTATVFIILRRRKQRKKSPARETLSLTNMPENIKVLDRSLDKPKLLRWKTAVHACVTTFYSEKHIQKQKYVLSSKFKRM